MSRDNLYNPLEDVNAVLSSALAAVDEAALKLATVKAALQGIQSATDGMKGCLFVPSTLLTPPADWQPPVEVKVVDLIINAAESHAGDPAAIVDAIAVGHALVPIIDSAFYTAMQPANPPNNNG